ncbi:Ig-like domain-containing protein [bacterium]|nr:Ig-like domain-containing protein [candidate division CSSED10-310 bacterium]
MKRGIGGCWLAAVFIYPVLFCCINPPGHAFGDNQPPAVEYTSPFNFEIQVNPQRPIEVYLNDLSPQMAIPVSGINIATIKVRIQENEIPVFVDILEGERVFVHSNLPTPMPPDAWINVEIDAVDHAGNIMPTYRWSFRTDGIPDEDPPTIFGESPPDGSMNVVRTAQISCKIYDGLSGIDLNSIKMEVEQAAVEFTLTGTTETAKLIYQPPTPFEYGEWVTVTVSTADRAGNTSESTWDFQTESIPILPPEPVLPEDGALLNYHATRGKIVFSWTSDNPMEYYRMVLVLVNYPAMEVIDFGPLDYTRKPGNLVEVTYELARIDWDHMASLGQIKWFVLKISGYNGHPISGKSEDSFFSLAASDVVVLRSPQKYWVFFSNDAPPIFMWDSFEGVESYMLGVARLGESGQMVTDIFEYDLGAQFTSFFLNYEQWKSYPNGKYIWSVIGTFPDGSKTDFMNLYFYKSGQRILQFLLPPM